METATIVNKRGILSNPDLLNGKWKLTYNIQNALKADGFGGMLLEPYQDPFTRKTIYPLDVNNNSMQIGFFVDSIVNYLMPDQIENNAHYNLVMFMLGHPNVRVENIPINSTFGKSKKSNPEFVLVNLDYAKDEEISNQEVIDRVIGLLSLDSGVNALSATRLQYVLAQLNEAFIDRRYITNPSKLKTVLRTRVKDFVRKSVANANKVQGIIDNIDQAKRTYLVKYLINLNIIEFASGSFRLEGRSLGHSDQAVVTFIEQHPEIQAKFEQLLSDHLKQEEDKS